MKYIKNAEGGVQAVSDEHYDKYLTVRDDAGNIQLKPGYEELKEKDARKSNPQLFGEVDPHIVYSAKELVAKRKYAQELAAFQKADAEATQTPIDPVPAATPAPTASATSQASAAADKKASANDAKKDK
ncbi:hypothetical protein OZX57_06490 [Bifidobacterium sp. ESL0682]|uniref:hypothetical protein n=1 Tax=Bifidobacterium sp. ESL0682 TaxID=2983212 RepID=UPI0023F96FFA|nr:hypothetical protein [Bifidobacterium sp. ESL0682]WEV41634.1 hypothetical protein OZX57_06490 [Bifidobacterium sp. ESL0682]